VRPKSHLLSRISKVSANRGLVILGETKDEGRSSRSCLLRFS
jgi:hypothetical protein